MGVCVRGASGAAPEQPRRAACPSPYIAMANRAPVWEKRSRAYCLNFAGRVTRPSAKNFQLCAVVEKEARERSTMVLQFGKAREETRPASCPCSLRVCMTAGRRVAKHTLVFFLALQIGTDTFTMDVAWPLSPLQAFAICLTAFTAEDWFQ